MKYSKAFERDYEFYYANLVEFAFSGGLWPCVQFDSGGPDAKQCFYIYDSTGKLKPCCQPKLLQRLLVCKASVNLNIKLWAQGIEQHVLCPPELKAYLDSIGAPDWVLKSALRQGERRLLKQVEEKLCQK